MTVRPAACALEAMEFEVQFCSFLSLSTGAPHPAYTQIPAPAPARSPSWTSVSLALFSAPLHGRRKRPLHAAALAPHSARPAHHLAGCGRHRGTRLGLGARPNRNAATPARP